MFKPRRTIDPSRSLEEIKAAMEDASADTGAVRAAIIDLCDHLLAQESEMKRVRASVPTLGQIHAVVHGTPLDEIQPPIPASPTPTP